MDRIFSPQNFLTELAEELISNFARAGRATTSGLVGSAREHEVRRKLQSVLPAKVGVASGCVIDSYGATSRQTDVILFEKDQCPVFSVNDDPAATYIPCEGVMAVGEIKSSLGTGEINDAVDKIAKIKSLKRYFTNPTCFRRYGSHLAIQGASSETFDPINKPLDQVFGFVLCESFSLSATTLIARYAQACSRYSPHLSPNMLVSLKDGLVMFSSGKEVCENRHSASHLFICKMPDGEVPFLIHKLAMVANDGRTTQSLPYTRYLLKSGKISFGDATFYELTSCDDAIG